jgi:SGNH domain (fused to AT3 domains)
VKGISTWQRRASALLLTTCSIVTCGGIPLPLVSKLAQGPAIVAAAAVKPLRLPTTSEVIQAVADGVKFVQYPPQPPPIDRWRPGCSVSYEATTSPLCIYGDPHGTRLLVVYGDSHAAMWLPALDALGKFTHLKVVQITKATCQVPDFPSWIPEEQRPYTQCSAFRSFALAQIRQLHPDIVLLSSIWKYSVMAVDGHPTSQGLEAAWDSGLASMLLRIKPLTGRVIVLGDFAYNPQGGTDCLATHTNDVRPCNTPRQDAVYAAHNQMERSVAERHGALYVDTIPWFCTATVCPAVVGGLATHFGANHVSPTYALWLADALATATKLLPGGSA